jgi:hypothetical protein
MSNPPPQNITGSSKTKWLFALAVLITGVMTMAILAWRTTVMSSTQSNPAETTLSIGKDDTATVKGPILDNIKQCTVDLDCYLKMRFQDQDVHVVYVTNEGQRCINEQAAKQGFAIKKGQRVEAHGQYRKEGDLHLLSTCPSNAFYIKLLPPFGRTE